MKCAEHIPTMARRRCFYAVLGVERDATELDIKVAYRKAALQVYLSWRWLPRIPVVFVELCQAAAGAGGSMTAECAARLRAVASGQECRQSGGGNRALPGDHGGAQHSLGPNGAGLVR